MDLLSAAQQQHRQTGDAGADRPGASSTSGMTNDGMSKPSLISSLWSIQVQNEGSASDFPMGDCGSQQSLPEMLKQTSATAVGYHHRNCNCNGFSGHPGSDGEQVHMDLGGGIPMEQQQAAMISNAVPMASSANASLRPVKSLSDLHTLTAAQIAQTAAVMPCHHHDAPPPNEQVYPGFRRQTETGAFYNMLSRQQRDSQICEWLQKLNVSGGGAETSGSESPQEFHPQHRPPFHRADTTEQ